jgi:hypothetical protein
MFCCLSQGDETDLIPFFGMGVHNNCSSQKTQGDEALFSVVEAVILKGERDALEDLLCIDEI